MMLDQNRSQRAGKKANRASSASTRHITVMQVCLLRIKISRIATEMRKFSPVKETRNTVPESEHMLYTSNLFADHTPASPLSSTAIIGIAAPGTVIVVVVLLFAVTILLVRKHSHSKQTTVGLYEIPGMKEPDEAYGTNTHIATEMMPYMPVAEKVPMTIQNKAYAYGSVSGGTVNTDTEEQDDVDEIYEVLDAIGMKEPNKAYGTNTHITIAANDGIPVAENMPYMPVAERVQTIHSKACGSVSGAAVNTDNRRTGQCGCDL